jgi:hypothetical protein
LEDKGLEKPVTFGRGRCSWGNKYFNMNIKATLLHNIALMSLAATLLLLPFDATAAAMALAFIGLLAIAFADYGRNIEPLRVPAEVVKMGDSDGSAADLRAAA